MEKHYVEAQKEARAFIDAHGGCTQLAKKLQMEMPIGAARVSNWKRRGLPMWLKAMHPDLIRQFREQEARYD